MKELCDHPSVYFGSGGYYIFCKTCSVIWVAAEQNSGRSECREGMHTYSGKPMINADERVKKNG